MVLCAISDRNASAGDCRGFLLRQATRLAQEGVDLFQIREKDLAAGKLADLSRTLLSAVRHTSTKLVINGRADVAIAVGAHGVHLTSGEDELTPAQVRRLYAEARLLPPVVTVSCHTLAEVQRHRVAAADFILFGPIFEKVVGKERLHDGVQLEELRAACVASGPVPVLALGGVTAANLEQCLEAGARGIAGIRLFKR